MDSLLIINNDAQKLARETYLFLTEHYHVTTAINRNHALWSLEENFYDLFLIVANEFDDALIKLIETIKKDRDDWLPAVIVFPELDERRLAQAHKYRAFYLIKASPDLDLLKVELTRVSKILDIANDKRITFSTRKYDRDYRLSKIIYFERNRPRNLKIVSLENGAIVEEEIFFKNAIEDFIQIYGLKRYFVQVHQSHLVNPKFIRKYDKAEQEVILTTNKKLPLGGTFYKKIKGEI